jgi:hypothetical protein
MARFDSILEWHQLRIATGKGAERERCRNDSECDLLMFHIIVPFVVNRRLMMMIRLMMNRQSVRRCCQRRLRPVPNRVTVLTATPVSSVPGLRCCVHAAAGQPGFLCCHCAV